jgi:hypothetical protein
MFRKLLFKIMRLGTPPDVCKIPDVSVCLSSILTINILSSLIISIIMFHNLNKVVIDYSAGSSSILIGLSKKNYNFNSVYKIEYDYGSENRTTFIEFTDGSWRIGEKDLVSEFQPMEFTMPAVISNSDIINVYFGAGCGFVIRDVFYGARDCGHFPSGSKRIMTCPIEEVTYVENELHDSYYVLEYCDKPLLLDCINKEGSEGIETYCVIDLKINGVGFATLSSKPVTMLEMISLIGGFLSLILTLNVIIARFYRSD